jgi:hypothetical protein
MNKDGVAEDLTIIGTVLYISVVNTVLLQTVLNTFSFSWLYIGFMVASVKLIYAYLFLVSYVPFPTEALIGIITVIFSTAPALLNIFITPLVNLLISYMYKLLQQLKYPTLLQQYRMNPLVAASQPSPFRQRLL